VAWSFAVDNAALQFLAEGEQLSQSYTITVDDDAGGTVSQDVTVTITGANDAAVVTGGITSGSVMEDVSETTSGTIDFGDVDLTDTHVVSATPAGGGYIGTFTANLTTDSTGDGSGQVTWSFTIANDVLRAFPEGQVLTQIYTVVIDDGAGGTVAQDVIIRINELNDFPVITGAVSTGAVTEDALPTAASGTIDFADEDLADTHTVSVTPTGSGYLGTLTADVTDPATGDGFGQVTWNYAVANTELQFLAAGQVLTQTYTVAIDDGVGGVATQTITITNTGTNDGPAIPGAVVAGTVTEDTLPTAAQGTIDFSDVDLTDTHAVSVTPAAGGYLGTLTASVSNPATGDGSGQVSWSFAAANGALQSLAGGQQLTQTYTIAIDDGAGGTVSQDVTITITGNNDAPLAVNDAANTPATPLHESNTQATTELVGSVSLLGNDSDADAGQTALLRVTRVDGTAVNQTAGVETAIAGIYGTLFVRADGNYRYVLDNTDPDTQALAAGQPATESFLYTAANNGGGAGNEASATLTIAIEGTDDASVITGPTSGTVVEAGAAGAGTPTASGDLLATDVDGPDDQWQQVSAPTTSLNGFGTFTMSASGAWAYTLGNANPTVGALNSGQTLSDSFTVMTADGVSQVVSITVQGANDAPATDLNGLGPGSGSTATFTEDAGAVAIAPAATIADIDDANMESMTVTLTNRPDGIAFERLSLNAAAAAAAAAAGLAVSYAEATGVLSISGSASRAAYETVLHGVQYDNTDQAPDTTARIVNVVVNDGDVGSAVNSATITVVAVNDPPGPITDTDGRFNSVSETAAPGTGVNINVSAVDQDGNNPVTYSLIDSADGRFAIDPVTGVVTVASALDFEFRTIHTITVGATDSLGAVQTATFTINVSNVVSDVDDDNSTYVINPATGFFGSTIQDTDGGADRIEFAANGAVFSSLNFENIDENTDDLLISWTVPGESDSVNVVDHYGSDTIEYLSFGGGASYLGYQLGGVTYRMSTQNNSPLDGTSGNDMIASNTSAQTLNGFGGNDLLFGNSGFDTLNGDSGDDLLVGGTGDDRLNGGTGNDVLFGGRDNDTLDPGAGLDRLVYAESVDSSNRDTVNGYNGTGASKDVFDLSALLDANFGPFSNVSDFVRIVQSGSNILLQVDTNGPSFGASFNTVASITGYNTPGNIVSVFFENTEYQLVV
jgi:VCBS repeat-containing protein